MMDECEKKLPEMVSDGERAVDTAENDLAERYAELEKKYELLRRQNLLEKVSSESGCTDPGYLEYCAVRQQVDIDDAEALRKFAGELAAVSPGCFKARITPGSSAGSSGASPVSSAGKEEFAGDRISMIALSIDSAPDVAIR